MAHPQKLSLISAIFININIMLGSGIFINSTILAQKAGIFGAFCYVFVGLLMLPLIISITKLLSIHPSGGFYTFGSKEIHPFAGFFSAWSYSTGKLASAVIITQLAVLLIQGVIPFFGAYNPLLLNGIIMSFFIVLNMLDIKTSSTIQACFFGLKTIPILFGILVGLYLFSGANIPAQHVTLTDISFALPLVLFAIAGFEAACSLSSQIENAQKNAPRAVFISFFVVIAATTLFQLMIYGALGTALAAMPDYRSLFPALVSDLLPVGSILQSHLTNLLHLAIAASALGGSYGIIFSNNWNLYTLAQHGHLFGSKKFIQFNRYHIPWLCVLLEGAIYLLFLLISHGSQIPLQQMGALGQTIAYTLSAFSLYFAVNKHPNLSHNSKWIALLAMGSCLLLLGSVIYGLIKYGFYSLITFAVLLTIGTFMFWLTRNQSTNLNGNQS